MKRIYFLLLSIFFALSGQAQEAAITGRVIDIKTGLPLFQTHVFVPNTSFQTFTDSTGMFVLSGLPAGQWTVIVAKAGYQLEEKEIIAKKSIRGEVNQLNFELASRAEHDFSTPKRKKTKKLTDHFVAKFHDLDNSQQIELINRDALEFEINKETKSTTAWAEDILVFKNTSNGYLISVWADHGINMDLPLDFTTLFWTYIDVPGMQGESKLKVLEKRLAIYKNSPEFVLRQLMTSPSDTIHVSFGKKEGEFNLYTKSPLVIQRASGVSTVYQFDGSHLVVKENGSLSSNPGLKVNRGENFSYPLMSLPQNFYAEKLLALEQIERNARVLEEKVFLHTDRDVYRIGDQLYFTAYISYGNPLLAEESSKVLHVELLDTLGKQISHQIFPIEKGIATGQVPLSSDLRSRDYILKAYTLWATNYGEAFEFKKPIQVLTPGFSPNYQAHSELSNGVTVFTETINPNPGDSVKLHIMIRDIQGNLIPAQVSVSVLDQFEAPILDEQTALIGTYLQQEMPDSAMELSEFTQTKEMGFSLEGQTMDANENPIKSELEILVNGLLERWELNTAVDGSFALENLQFPNEYVLAVKATDMEGKPVRNIELKMKRSPLPFKALDWKLPTPIYSGNTSMRLDSLGAIPPLQFGEILLESVEVTQKRSDPIGPMIYGRPQNVVETKDLNLDGTINQFMYAFGTRAGFIVRGTPPNISITGRGGMPPMLMINGIPLSEPMGTTFGAPSLSDAQYSRISQINVFNIERIESSRFTTSVLGAAGGAGYINFILKTGEDAIRDQQARTNNFKEFSFKGLERSQDFTPVNEVGVSPVYHWEPDLVISIGETFGSTSFLLPSYANGFWVVVNGVTRQGAPVYGRFLMKTAQSSERP